MTAHRPIAFATAFREHVVPHLKAKIEVEAFFVALRSTDFSAAYSTIVAEALRLGASSLSDDRFYDLDDWIGGNLLKSTLAAETRIAAIQAEMNADPARFFASVATDRTRWIFAAVCPEFRRRLRAERCHGH